MVDSAPQDHEREVDVSRARLAAIVDSSDDAIVSKTLDGVITSWNRGAERIFGWTAAEAIGRHIVSLIIPADRRGEEDDVLARLRRGERIDHFETVRATRDGRLLDVSLTVSPIRDSTGRIVGASKIARDITDQKRTAQALVVLRDELARQVKSLTQLGEDERRARETAEGLAKAARDINTLDPDAALQRITESACALLRADVAVLYRADPHTDDMALTAAAGPLATTLNHKILVPRGTGLVGLAVTKREAVVSADILTDERFVHAPEMRARIVAASHRGGLAVPLTVQGRVIGALFVGVLPGRSFSPDEVRLVTTFADQAAVSIANAELYQDLERTNRTKDEFLAMLGHELRNPLGAIAGALGVLKIADGKASVAQQARAVIDRQFQHLSRLVDDLLDVSRVTTGKVRLDRRPLDLGELATSAMTAWREAGRFARHRVSLDAVPAWIDADETRMEQVLENLLGNALKYTPAGGAVSVRVAAEDDVARLEVADTGAGLPPNMAHRVFDLFVQGDRTLDRAQGGLGIGLTLVKALVGLHEGTVDARSDGPGQGSVFTVRLPRVPAPRAAATHPSETPTASTSRRVLIVEDNGDAREMLVAALTLAGHQVHEAADGAAGLAVLDALAPDVALIDVGLPEMDGYEVARRIRASSAGRSIVLIALTGYGQAEDRRRALDAGFDAHVTKPVLPDELAELIAGARRGVAAAPSGPRGALSPPAPTRAH